MTAQDDSDECAPQREKLLSENSAAWTPEMEVA